MAARVSVRDLKDKLDAGHPLLIVDVREGFCDSDRMIPGAVHVDAKHLAPDLFKLPQDAEIVVYDNQPQSETALRVAEALVSAGFKAEALLGGWDQWKKAGYPTEARHDISLREGRAQTKETAETPVERAQQTLQETAGELGESAQHARTGMLDVAQRAVSLVISLFRR